MEPLGVGLHIIYGRMGSGKTNFAVGEILEHTTYKKIVLNVPLTPEYKETTDKEYTIFKKLEPEKCIRLIDEEHQDTLFIIDEAQMVLLSANKLLVDSFLKKMSQIRQNNQCVLVIAQISKMLPNSIKDLAESCFFFQNENVKGKQKQSKVKRFRTGYDYTTRLVDTFIWKHIYGNYESTNTPTTEKPQNMYKRTYFRLFVIFGVALILFVFVGYKLYSFVYKNDDNIEIQTNENSVISNFTNKLNIVAPASDSLCIRSWEHLPNSVVRVMLQNGQIQNMAIHEFSLSAKCSL